MEEKFDKPGRQDKRRKKSDKKSDKFKKKKRVPRNDSYEDDFDQKRRKRGKSMKKRSEKYTRSNNRVDRFFDDEDEDYERKTRFVASRRRRQTAHKKNIHTSDSKSNLIRLNRYIANSGICSRREADNYISSGLVKVNGKKVTELGTKVHPDDEVVFNGKKIRRERNVYILLNKPKGFVTTRTDPHAEKTVVDLVRNACKERIYPVGRLDKASTGVLLLTNDGQLTKRLTHPSYNHKKVYNVALDKPVKDEDLKHIANGLELEDGIAEVDLVEYLSPEDKSTIYIELHSGKNRIIRRLFEHLDYKVKRLDRMYFAGLTKKGLKRGKWRFLTDKEIGMLYRSFS